MSKNAEAILHEIQSLSLNEQRELWQELGRLIAQVSPSAPVELYGEPLTDDDIEEGARVAFNLLDEAERAKPR